VSVPDAPARLLVGALGLVALAAVLLVSATGAGSESVARGREFQRMTGGLGLGASLDLAGCGYGFDPRLFPACARRHDLLPCADAFCARHGGFLPVPGADR
jgi:hypothetical protein